MEAFPTTRIGAARKLPVIPASTTHRLEPPPSIGARASDLFFHPQ
jgi:hypothetical protein